MAIREELNIEPRNLDMTFNYKPITYGEIKQGQGRELNPNSQCYKLLCVANENHKSLADVLVALGEKERCFNSKIAWENDIFLTITARLDRYRGKEKTMCSIEDLINAQTFPQDYDFINRAFNNVAYFCGMSVPPVMIKRVVTRLIEQGVFDYKLGV